MAIYVSKRGNDSNDGSSLILAKATIGGAIAELSAADEIIVHAGHYHEVIQTDGLAGTTTITGIGKVVLDGGGVLGNAIVGGTTRCNFNSIEFRNYVHYAGMIYRTISTISIFTNCRFIGSGIPGQAAYSTGGTASQSLTFDRCLITGFDIGIRSSRSGQYFYANRCTFDCVSKCFESLDVSPGKIVPTSCLFITDTGYVFHGTITGVVGSTSNFNRYWITGAGVLARIASTDYSNLAAWQGLSSFDASSSEGDPQVLDRAKQVYILNVASPLIGAGETVGTGVRVDIGAFNPGFAITANVNSSLWGANAIMVNTEYSAVTERFRLQAGEAVGTVSGDVLDMGADRKVSRIFTGGLEDPLNSATLFDLDTGDEVAEIEVRTQTATEGAFAKANPTPAWTAINRAGDLNLYGRYLQIRVTLRNNGDLA